MISEYHRPAKIEEVLALLSRKTPKTVPLGGGTSISQSRQKEDLAVVDLQSLGMREIEVSDGKLNIGANVTLQQFIANNQVSTAFRTAAQMECNYNLRQMATIGGTIASFSGRSAFHALLLATEAEIELEPRKNILRYSEFIKPEKHAEPGFISSISIPLQTKTALRSISRTPESESILCVCGGIDSAGLIRITITRQDSHFPEILFKGTQLDTKAIPNPYPGDAYKSAAFQELLGRVLSDLQGGK
jgi:CO/xanthine dehydrogenase FAD-binding subunit